MQSKQIVIKPGSLLFKQRTKNNEQRFQPTQRCAKIYYKCGKNKYEMNHNFMKL